jgi:ribosome-binding factor A
MSHRKEQVASTLQRAVQQVIGRGLNDPRIRGLITVTEVQVPSDLRTATIMISVLPEERQTLTLKGIQDAARHIRREVGELVALNQIPELHFKLDLSLKRQAQAMQAISKAAAERAAAGDAGADDAPVPDAPEPADPADPEPTR